MADQRPNDLIVQVLRPVGNNAYIGLVPELASNHDHSLDSGRFGFARGDI